MADDIKKIMLEVLDSLANLRAGKRGRYYAELFMVEPDGDEYPEYYEVIKNPMAIETVKGKYSDLDEFEADTRLIFSNAMVFNEENSQVYNDASILERTFDAKMASRRKLVEDGSSKSKKRKQPGEDDHARSVKLKISLKEPEERPSKIKLSIGKGRLVESEPEPEPEEYVPEEEVKEEKPVLKRPRGRPPRNPKPESDLEPYANDAEGKPEQDQKQELGTGAHILPSSVPALPVVVPTANDIKNATPGSKVGPGQSTSHSNIAEESRNRAPGKTIADALITHFALSSASRHPSFPPYAISFPPHDTEVFQSYTITLPPMYSVVTISPTLSHSLLTRHYNLYMSLNNRRLSPTIAPGNGVRKTNEPPKSFYEVKLNPGVNMIECLVHASPPPPPGVGGRVVAPQRYGLLGGTNSTVSSEGSEKERIVVWILVQR